MHTPSHTNVCKSFNFSAITPEMLKLCRVTKVKVFFSSPVYVFNFDLFDLYSHNSPQPAAVDQILNQ